MSRALPPPAQLNANLFQIPMRGNENIELDAQPGQCYMFQIPMRGNENQMGAAMMVFDSVFQIPMRGNEVP